MKPNNGCNLLLSLFFTLHIFHHPLLLSRAASASERLADSDSPIPNYNQFYNKVMRLGTQSGGQTPIIYRHASADTGGYLPGQRPLNTFIKWAENMRGRFILVICAYFKVKSPVIDFACQLNTADTFTPSRKSISIKVNKTQMTITSIILRCLAFAAETNGFV